LGKNEMWRSLRTDSLEVAKRRLHAAAAEVEVEFERARLIAMVGRSQSSITPSITCGGGGLIEQIAARVVTTISQTAANDRGSSVSLGDVYGRYLADARHDWCPRTAHSYRTTRKWVIDGLGAETAMREITREQCRDFLNCVRTMPKHAEQRFPKLSFRQAVELARANPEIDRISAANVNAYMVRLSALMNWAMNEGFISSNPARGLKIPDPVRRRDKRNPFCESQLRRIFEALEATTRGRNSARRARFWVPLIALFSGMRLNEICQLDVADMVVIDGVLCFNVASGFDQEDT
jgi:integrase